MKALFLKRKKGYKRHDPYQIMEPIYDLLLIPLPVPPTFKKKKIPCFLHKINSKATEENPVRDVTIYWE